MNRSLGTSLAHSISRREMVNGRENNEIANYRAFVNNKPGKLSGAAIYRSNVRILKETFKNRTLTSFSIGKQDGKDKTAAFVLVGWSYTQYSVSRQPTVLITSEVLERRTNELTSNDLLSIRSHCVARLMQTFGYDNFPDVANHIKDELLLLAHVRSTFMDDYLDTDKQYALLLDKGVLVLEFNTAYSVIEAKTAISYDAMTPSKAAYLRKAAKSKNLILWGE